jgi:hypothetical protein
LFKLGQECLFSSSGLIDSEQEKVAARKFVHRSQFSSDHRSNMNSLISEVTNSAGLVVVGSAPDSSCGPEMHGVFNAATQRESGIADDEEDSVMNEKSRKDLQEALVMFFEQEDPGRGGVIESSKASSSSNSFCFRLIIAFVSVQNTCHRPT